MVWVALQPHTSAVASQSCHSALVSVVSKSRQSQRWETPEVSGQGANEVGWVRSSDLGHPYQQSPQGRGYLVRGQVSHPGAPQGKDI